MLALRGEKENGGPLLLSECPAFVRYITQSKPELLPSLVPLKPARQLMSHLLRQQISSQTGKPVSDISIVFLSPCTAAKNETASALRLREPGYLPDFALTTREVYRLIRLFGIEVESLDTESQEDLFGTGAKSGHLSAISGGYAEMLTRIIQTRNPGTVVTGEKPGKIRGIKDVKETTFEIGDKKIIIAAVSSIAQFEQYSKELRTRHRKVDFIEAMACQHGCINGGGQPCRGSDRNLRNRLKGILDWDEKYSGIQTRGNLEVPAGLSIAEEDVKAVFSPRLIIK
jgi:iron only hydrogenase large subunit-like protein